MMATSLDIRQTFHIKLVVTTIALMKTHPLSVIRVIFACVLSLSHPYGLFLWKMCMSYCVVCS